MSKGNKLGKSLEADAVNELQRTMNPLTGIETGALQAAKEMERRMKPLAGIDAGAIEAAKEMQRRMNPFAEFEAGALSKTIGFEHLASRGLVAVGLHHSLADHVAQMIGGDTFKAMQAAKPMLDAMNSAKPAVEALRAPSLLHDWHRTIGSQFGISGLNDLRRGVTERLGAPDALASLEMFTRVRDLVGASLGTDVLSRWDRFAAATAIPTIASLSLPFERPTAVMTLAKGDALGTLAWLERPADEQAPPKVVVVALHSKRPSRPWRELRIATGAAINCRRCGRPFELNLQLWLTSEELEVFFQGEMLPQCVDCSGSDDLFEDVPLVSPYRLVDGGGEGDGTPTGKLALVVSNTRDEGDG